MRHQSFKLTLIYFSQEKTNSCCYYITASPPLIAPLALKFNGHSHHTSPSTTPPPDSTLSDVHHHSSSSPPTLYHRHHQDRKRIKYSAAPSPPPTPKKLNRKGLHFTIASEILRLAMLLLSDIDSLILVCFCCYRFNDSSSVITPCSLTTVQSFPLCTASP